MPNKKKVRKVLREFKEGSLKSSSGSKVSSRKQAIAIAMSEGGYSEKRPKEKSAAVKRLSMKRKSRGY